MTRPQPILSGMPLLIPTVSFMAGVTLAAVMRADYLIYGAAFMVALLILCILIKRVAVAIATGFVCLGMMSVAVRNVPEPFFTGQEEVYSGVVDQVWYQADVQRALVHLSAQNDGNNAKVMLRVCSPLPVILEGDTVTFKAVLKPAASSVQHLPGSLYPERMFWRYGATAEALIPPSGDDAGDALVVCHPHRMPWGVRMLRMRESFISAIFDSGLSNGAASFLTAVLTGDNTYLDDSTRQDFSTAGVAHVLALSGTHVAVIAFMVSLLLFPLRLARCRRTISLLTIAVLWFYAILTGMCPSVTRAVVMATMVGLAMVLKRDSSPLNSLCLAALLILLVKPRELFFPGFQLSFIAVASIVMFSYYFVPTWRMPGWLRTAWVWVAVCLSAVVGTSALAAWHFHTLPLCFLVANVVVALLLPAVMFGGLLTVVLYALGHPIGFLIGFTDWCYRIIDESVTLVNGIDHSSITGIYFPGWLLLFYYIGLVALWISLRRQNKAVAVAGVMMLAAFLVAIPLSRTDLPRAEAYVMDYPYATVLVAREGSEARILTDAPPTQYETIERVASAVLPDFTGRSGALWGRVNEPIRGTYIDADSTLWRIGELVVAPVGLNKDLKALHVKPHYALIGVRFFGKISSVCDVMHPDTVALSPALGDDMRIRYSEEMDTLGIPYRVGLPFNLFAPR